MNGPSPSNGINTSDSEGIDKRCKNCGKSSIEGAIFGLRKAETKDGQTSYEKLTCKVCEAKYAKQRRTSHSEMIAENKNNYRKKHHGTIKHHVQEKIATWRKASNVPSDLTVEYLISLYEMQDGYCYYSKEKMVFGWVDGKVHHNSLSLDKLDPAKGYVKGNVVWCTYLINTMKQDMTEQQFYSAINQIYATTYGVPMVNDISIADKLRQLTLQSKLGDLPKVIEKAASEEAKKGNSSCRLYFYEGPKSLLPFYGSLGPAFQEIWRDILRPFDRRTSITEQDFLKEILELLERETGLKITLHTPPHFLPNNVIKDQNVVKMYAYGASVVLDVSWE